MCHTIPPAKVHPRLFKGAGRHFNKIPWRAVAARERNCKPRTEASDTRRRQRLSAADERRRERIKELGIDYEFAGYATRRNTRLESSPPLPLLPRTAHSQPWPKLNSLLYPGVTSFQSVSN